MSDSPEAPTVTLSDEITEWRMDWLKQLPGPNWAERYDGGWESVADLLDRSKQEAKNQKEAKEKQRQVEIAYNEELKRNNEQLRRQKEDAQRTQSLYLAHRAREEREKGDAVTAILLALRALPTQLDPHDRPAISQAWTELFAGLRAQQERLICRGHERPVQSASFSPDGSQIVTGSSDGTARLLGRCKRRGAAAAQRP